MSPVDRLTLTISLGLALVGFTWLAALFWMASS